MTELLLQLYKNKLKKIQVLAVVDPYNPTGSSRYISFNTSKNLRWECDADRSHINWAILDSTWEGEFCRIAEVHPKVHSYVKNHAMGFEVPISMKVCSVDTSQILY